MTTTAFSHRAAGSAGGGYSFRTVARMEWEKLRTVRSTGYIVAVFAVGMVGLAVLALSHENYARLSAADRASFDPAHDCFIGLVLGQLLLGTLGVLAITAEFSSGMIRATFAAGQAALISLAPHAALGQPGVLRAVLMAGAYPALIALISLGLGALIRHTAGAIGAMVGLLFVLPLLIAPLGTSVQNAAQNFL